MKTIIYGCPKCGFKFEDESPIIFYLDKNNEIKDYEWLILNGKYFKESQESPLTGTISRTICKKCRKIVKIYTVNSNSENLTNEEIEKLIKKAMKKGEKPYLTYAEEEHINCPYCNSKTESKVSIFTPCPKCGNELNFFNFILSD